MRPDVATADRHHAVRNAALGWRRAGAIDDATLRAIAAAYPDDRVRLGLGLRILAGGAALIGGAAFAGFLFALSGAGSFGSLFWIVLAALFIAATEIQTGRLRRADAGAEFATALLAVAFAGAWIASWNFDSEGLVAAAFALAAGLAAWRWGYATLAGAAAALSLFAAAQLPFGRVIWVMAGAAALPMILGLARSPRLAPAHRRCFLFAGFVFLAGGYVAANVYSVDRHWIDWFWEGSVPNTWAWAGWAATAGTILIPPAVLVIGARYRDRVLLAAGALFTAASLVTLRQYHSIGPLWLVSVLSGVACLGLAIWLRRWLHTGNARERAGFTAEPLFEDPRARELVQTAAVVAAMSPAARAVQQPGFTGGGGRSGGGGATGTV